mgnify:CR=1 FL=1
MSTNKSFSTETSERYARALYEVSKESSELKKIEVSFKKNNKNELNLELPNVLAIVTDQNQKRTIPNFQHDQITEIAEFILKIV